MGYLISKKVCKSREKATQKDNLQIFCKNCLLAEAKKWASIFMVFEKVCKPALGKRLSGHLRTFFQMSLL